jgi:hypothetical protein
VLYKFILFLFFLGALVFPVYIILLFFHIGPQEYNSKVEWGGLCLIASSMCGLMLEIESEEDEHEEE